MRDVVGYEDLYAVSDDGRVWSKRRQCWLSSQLNHSGYVKVGFFINGKIRRKFVHRLVCEAFNGPAPTPSHQVDHINAVHDDNRPENLRWTTNAENVKYAIERGLGVKKRAVVAFNEEGDVIKFKTMSEAQNQGFTSLRRSLIEKHQLSRGYAFVYAEDWPEVDPKKYFEHLRAERAEQRWRISHKSRKNWVAVRGISVEDGSVVEFPSAHAAIKAGYTTVWHGLKYEGHTCCGRIWERIDNKSSK